MDNFIPGFASSHPIRYKIGHLQQLDTVGDCPGSMEVQYLDCTQLSSQVTRSFFKSLADFHYPKDNVLFDMT